MKQIGNSAKDENMMIFSESNAQTKRTVPLVCSPSGTLIQRDFITRYVKTVTRVDRRTGDTTVVERATSLTERRLYRGAFERQGSKWILHTGVGHYDLTEGKHYYYIKDNLGSTVAVVDQSGVAHQLTAYYPSGVPYDLTAAEARATDQLHIGNRWIAHEGMNTYDNTARMHYPVLPSFDTPDPLAEQYPHLSPYAHCAANPLMYVDPSGKKIEYDKNMLPEHRNALENMFANCTELSSTFKYIYDELFNSATTYTISIASEGLLGDVNGYYNPADRSITYDLNKIWYNTVAFIEEIVHSFQDEKGILKDKRYNSEFEAKLIATQVISESGYPKPTYENMMPSNWGKLLQYINESGMSSSPPYEKLDNHFYQKAGADFVVLYRNFNSNHHILVRDMSPLFKQIFKIK